MTYDTLLLAVGIVVLAAAGLRDLKVLFTALVAALVANLLLPLSPLGFTLTSQRLVALVAIPVCAFLFLVGRVHVPRPTPGQIAFVVTYGVIVTIHALHALVSPVLLPLSGIVSALLNMVLFCLVATIIHNLGPEDRQRLFLHWLPWSIVVIVTLFIADWAVQVLARPDLDPSRFHQGYRLRNDESRNIVNVWAAILVLTVPFIWRSLFGDQRNRDRLLGLGAVAVTAAAVVLTFSRAALLGLLVLLAAGLLFAVAGRLRLPGRNGGISQVLKSLPLAAGSIVLGGLVWFGLEMAGLPVASWVGHRVKPLLAGTDRSLQGRLDRLEVAWEKLQALPLLGYGPSPETLEHLPENTLLLATLYYGPVALLCVLAMLVIIGLEVAAWWWPRRRDPRSAAWPASYLAFLVLLISNDFLFFSMGSLLLATITAYTSPWSSPLPPSRLSYSST